MNNQSAFLLSVLSKCLPQDSELSYENKVQTIVRSKEYYDISRTPSFSTVFKDQFAQQKLRAYSDKELAGIVKALPLIPKVLDGIEKSLTSGVGPWLKEEDRPDFRNKLHAFLENASRWMKTRHKYGRMKAHGMRPAFYAATSARNKLVFALPLNHKLSMP